MFYSILYYKSLSHFHSMELVFQVPHLTYLCLVFVQTGDSDIRINPDYRLRSFQKLCDEIFGAGNFVAQFTRKGSGGRQDSKYILVQYPEMLDEASDMYKRGMETICDIGEERIKLAGESILKEYPDADIDIGFKVFRVADTNIKWNSFMDAGQMDLAQIETTPDFVDFMPGANDIDIVYELMLRQRDASFTETKLESSIISNLQKFLMEMGKGYPKQTDQETKISQESAM